MDVASENYRLLNEGLILSIDVRIKQNSWISNGILVFYILLALIILKKFISKSILESERLEQDQRNSIKDLSEKLKDAEEGLSDIREKEDAYLKNINALNKERENLSTDIDGLLEEMERLENGLKEQRELREEKEKEALYLEEEIEHLRGKIQKPGKKKKSAEASQKRFKVLYKNLEFTKKAIEGFLSLSDEFQLKAEEIIHRLNNNDSTISVKRKVFSKGGKIDILEMDFAYSGRIYFKRDSSSKIKIVIIGNKKSQNKDLAYLDREYN
jgi:DNA repair exonuclease SbcCD ATPase subunit